jgi:hypothetical protein
MRNSQPNRHPNYQPFKYTQETALEWRAMLKNPGNGIKPLNMRQLEIKLGLPRNTVTKILDKFGV